VFSQFGMQRQAIRATARPAFFPFLAILGFFVLSRVTVGEWFVSGGCDAGAKRDWFYFVNGVEADRGAAEYRLRPGDVLWWDYRSWSGDDMRQPVVVGAFPEPFLHGYDGRVRPVAVRFEAESMRGTALGLAHLIGARSVEPLSVPVGQQANVLVMMEDAPTFVAELRTSEGTAGSPVVFEVSFEDAKRLLKDPELAQHRYQGLAE